MTTPTQPIDTLIIGGGLSGLYAARLLGRRDRPVILLEARARLGGRILSPRRQGYFTDLGPSWYWPDMHPCITRLIQDLGLEGYRQFDQGLGRLQRADGSVQTVGGFTSEPASWRLNGGMQALTAGLLRTIPPAVVQVDHPVCRVQKEARAIKISVGRLEQPPQAEFWARNVILALPPRLAAATILFAPELSHELTQAMLKTSTWMAGQAKFYALYPEPFWRGQGLSGQAFSERGPLGEIHDGSNNGRGPFGLTGFVGLPAARRNPQQALVKAIHAQLATLFGPPAAQPQAFLYQDWAAEAYTATAYDQPPLYEHPLYQPPAGRISIWDNTLHFAGTETASQHGGYLEGALTAAQRAVDHLA